MKNIVLIPAAGVGSRFGGALPKQYATLLGQPVLQHTIHLFAQSPKIAHIAVVISPDDEYFAQYITLPKNAAVYRLGGQTRAQTVQNALNYLLQTKHIAQEDLVFVHDAARCCLSLAALNRLMDAAHYPDGALLAIAVSDTIKQQHPNQTVCRTIQRDGLWQAQTPQVFQAALLQRAFAQTDLNHITDEASAVEQLGLSPLLVEGDASNLKLTRPADALLMECVLQQRDNAFQAA